MTLETILVPLDGSDLPEAALETAIELWNEQPVAMLVLLRAAEASRPLGSDRTEKQVHAVREAESYLNGVVAGLREAGGEWGEPADDVAALSINFLFYGLRSRTPEPFRYLFCAFLESEPGSSATCRSRSRPMRCSPASMRPWRRADARASRFNPSSPSGVDPLWISIGRNNVRWRPITSAAGGGYGARHE